MADHQVSGELFAYEVLVDVRDAVHAIQGSSNVSGYDAIERLAPAIACLHFGHPERPILFLGRFRRRPWRCERCGRQYVTVRVEQQWSWTFTEATS